MGLFFTAKQGNSEENGVSQRIWLWRTALNETKKKPIFGYGLRSQRTLFFKMVHKTTLEKNLNFRVRESMLENAKKNLHSQYLQWFFDLGFFGTTIILFGLIYLPLAIKNSSKVEFILLYCLFIVIMITENLMDRQAGILFWSVCLPLFYEEHS